MLLNHQVYGSGVPLLILHGLFGSMSNWRSMGKQFARHFQVHLLDLRNHGQSFWSEHMDYPLMAQDVANYLREKKIHSAFLLGHSMGGKVAMQLALTQSERVKALVVADIAPINYDHNHADLLSAMQQLPLGQISDRRTADHALSQNIKEAPIRQFLLQNLIFEGTHSVPRWRINLDALESNMLQLFQFPEAKTVFDHPALFLRGDRSDYINTHHQAAIFQRFPQTHIETIEHAGHWLHAEQPNDFMQAVKHFLLSMVSPRAASA